MCFRLLSEFNSLLLKNKYTKLVIVIKCFRLLSEFNSLLLTEEEKIQKAVKYIVSVSFRSSILFYIIFFLIFKKKQVNVSVSFRSSILFYIQILMNIVIFQIVSVSFRSSILFYLKRFQIIIVSIVSFRLLSEFNSLLSSPN